MFDEKFRFSVRSVGTESWRKSSVFALLHFSIEQKVFPRVETNKIEFCGEKSSVERVLKKFDLIDRLERRDTNPTVQANTKFHLVASNDDRIAASKFAASLEEENFLVSTSDLNFDEKIFATSDALFLVLFTRNFAEDPSAQRLIDFLRSNNKRFVSVVVLPRSSLLPGRFFLEFNELTRKFFRLVREKIRWKFFDEHFRDNLDEFLLDFVPKLDENVEPRQVRQMIVPINRESRHEHLVHRNFRQNVIPQDEKDELCRVLKQIVEFHDDQRFSGETKFFLGSTEEFVFVGRQKVSTISSI